MCSNAAPSWYLPDSASCSTKPTSCSVRRIPWTVPLGSPSSPASSPTPSRRDRPDKSRRIAAARSIDWMEPGTGPNLLQCLGRRSEQQVARGGPRVLMADAAGSEIAGAPLARLQGDRGLHALLRGGGRPLERLTQLAALLEGVDRREQRVEHRLVTRLGLATRLNALDAGLDGCGPAVEVQFVLARRRRSHLQEQRAVERPGRTADARDQRHSDRLKVGA